MRILLTNDDGIHAEGMKVLMEWAKTIGEIVVYAPKVEQSAKAHAIEIHKPFEAKQVQLYDGSMGWAVDSTPADCVRFALFGLHKQFDVVISGRIHILHSFEDGSYSIFNVLRPGGVVGVDLLWTGSRVAPYFAMAAEASQILRFPATPQHSFAQQSVVLIHYIWNQYP